MHKHLQASTTTQDIDHYMSLNQWLMCQQAGLHQTDRKLQGLTLLCLVACQNNEQQIFTCTAARCETRKLVNTLMVICYTDGHFQFYHAFSFIKSDIVQFCTASLIPSQHTFVTWLTKGYHTPMCKSQCKYLMRNFVISSNGGGFFFERKKEGEQLCDCLTGWQALGLYRSQKRRQARQKFRSQTLLTRTLHGLGPGHTKL